MIDVYPEDPERRKGPGKPAPGVKGSPDHFLKSTRARMHRRRLLKRLGAILFDLGLTLTTAEVFVWLGGFDRATVLGVMALLYCAILSEADRP